MRGRDFLRIAFWSAVTSGNIGRMWQARSSSTQLPEIIIAPVGRPSLSARASSCIQAAMSRRECSCAWPWYCRSVTAAPVIAASSALLEEHGLHERLDLVAGALEGPHL